MNLLEAGELFRRQRAQQRVTVPLNGERSHLRVVGEGTSSYGSAALAGACAEVRAALNGTRNDELNRQAYKVAQLVEVGHVDLDDALAELRQAGLDAGLPAGEVEQVLRGGDTGALSAGTEAPREVELTGGAGAVDPSALLWTPPTVQQLVAPAPVSPEGPVPELTPEQREQLAREALLRSEVRTQWARREARRVLDDDEHVASFRVPAYTDTLAAELELPDEQVAYAVEQLVPAASNVLLAAQFKAGKSTLMLNLARAFADGTPFLGRFDVHAPEGRFAFFNYEVDRAQFRRWLRESHIAHPERVSVLNLRGHTLPLTVPRVAAWVVEWLKSHEVRWWCLDPFARAFTGDNENDNTQVARWLDALDEVKARAGVEVLIMPAHTGRETFEPGAERVRGATRLDDWADVRWILTRDENGGRFLRASGRDVDVAEEALNYVEATRELTFGGHDRAGAARRMLEDIVVTVVDEHPGIGVRDLRLKLREAGLKGRNDRIDAAVEAAVRYRRISREDRGNAGVRHYPIRAVGVAPAAWEPPTSGGEL